MEFYSHDQQAVCDTVRRFALSDVLPRAAAIDRDDAFDRKLYEDMAKLGLFGLALAPVDGGSGLDTICACIAIEELAQASGSVANAYAIPTSIALFLARHGTVEQKGVIPKLLDGSTIPAFSVTEPDFGSDVAGIRTSARSTPEGFVLNGVKAWVTLGEIADFALVYARTGDGPGHEAISCFMVDLSLPGVARGKPEELLGMHGLADCELSFSDVALPASALVGQLGQAFKMAMATMNFSRLMMSAMALGMARAAMHDAVSYARARKQFGQPIIRFQQIQAMIADMSTDIEAARLLIHHAARLYDEGRPVARQAAQAKLFTTEMATRHVSNALQIHGGNGYSRHYRIERLYRDVRLAQIYEGTNQIQRVIIARQIEKEAS